MTLYDISAARAKERARLFAASWEPSVGPAGVEKTRREKPLLADRHERLINEFAAEHVSIDKRADFYDNVLSRISGCPAESAVKAAIVAAAVEYGFAREQLRSLGLDVRYEQKKYIAVSKEVSKGAIA